MSGKYILIYVDLFWVYCDKVVDGDCGVGFKYLVMNVLDICRLLVWEFVVEDCFLVMWWVLIQLVEVLKVMEVWGFCLMIMKGFIWYKMNKYKGNSVIGMGYMIWVNSEDCLFVVCGKLLVCMDVLICQYVMVLCLENLCKLDVICEKLVQLFGDVLCIEFFVCQLFYGFDVWGNQCLLLVVELLSGCVVLVVKMEVV